MSLVYLFSAFLILGIFGSQILDLSDVRAWLLFFSNLCLSYIVIEVGLEFILDKKGWRGYLRDYGVATLSAILPWLMCFIYFFLSFDNSWDKTLMISRFAAPTASGILFAILAAGGIAATWTFRKIQILAILDDIDTILLMVPLQFILIGIKFKLFIVVVFIFFLIFLAYKYLHVLRLPTHRLWLFLYGVILTSINTWIGFHFDLEIEMLLPAFVLGSMLYNPHHAKKPAYLHEHEFIEPQERRIQYFDRFIKTIFMFIVGLLIPKIHFEKIEITDMILHVSAITILSNLGKCIPMFFYHERSLKERIALGIGMFPRGEVGAGILLFAIAHGANGYAATIAVLSLALNLILTWSFTLIVIRLVKSRSRTHLT